MHSQYTSLFEISAEATQCSTCAEGRSDARESTGTCSTGNDLDGVKAALPQWTAAYQLGYQATINSIPELYINQANTCGCKVPY